MGITKIALTGNPNTGKSSLFNHLTGLKQRVGNFPGVTVEKKTGNFLHSNGGKIDVIDLPGTYSLIYQSNDEKVVSEFVLNGNSEEKPDLYIYVADALNLERNLLLFTQLFDLGLPLILVLTMPDIAAKRKGQINIKKLSEALSGTPVITVNGRTGDGLDNLKKAIENFQFKNHQPRFGSPEIKFLLNDSESQQRDTEKRYDAVKKVLDGSLFEDSSLPSHGISRKIDRIIVHPVWGYLIFIGLLFLIFQVIFHIAAWPMDWIDSGFLLMSQWTKDFLPEGIFTDLIAEGIIPGIGGVLVFIPQIALLFLFLALLEESGYMSRVIFIMDKLVRPFGLNGKSVVPLMSSVACAIPGIMSARGISSWKDRIITIMVAPLMSCSARIPVYTLLIALVIPDTLLFGIFNLKGIVLLGLYALGLISALLVAFVMKFLVKSAEPGFLIMEMPDYKLPVWRNVFFHLWEKVRVFIFDAGKVILAISIILWALASYGPGDRIENAMSSVPPVEQFASEEEHELQLNSAKLENSYIGILGHAIEPVIRPLGYDWKIGIALITSFAAREVFVGSMATIYSIGEDFEDETPLLERLKKEKNSVTGQPVYTIASGVSLMLFYVYAMQCMATFAIVKRETRSWKWPLIQIVYMGILAYLAALLAYQLLS